MEAERWKRKTVVSKRLNTIGMAMSNKFPRRVAKKMAAAQRQGWVDIIRRSVALVEH